MMDRRFARTKIDVNRSRLDEYRKYSVGDHIIDAEQDQQQSENNELMNQLIRSGNQLSNKNTIVDVFSCNQHSNGGKQVNGEDTARSHGFRAVARGVLEGG